jgi:hypothetical protein
MASGKPGAVQPPRHTSLERREESYKGADGLTERLGVTGLSGISCAGGGLNIRPPWPL